MPQAVSFTVKVSPTLRRQIAALEPGKADWVQNAIRKTVVQIQTTAQRVTIARGRSKKAPPLRDKLTSRRGGAGLVGSIGTDFADLPFSGSVVSRLIYAPIHEFGLGVPKRPFLKPAGELNEEFFERTLTAEWKAAVRRA